MKTADSIFYGILSGLMIGLAILNRIPLASAVVGVIMAIGFWLPIGERGK